MKLENSKLILEFKKSGAELTRIHLKKDNSEMLWNGDSKYWGRHSPVLFPIVGKLKDNKTYILNKEYNMTQHGFARDMNFELIEETNTSIKFKLESDENTISKYPYKFELFITYTLSDDTIDVSWEVVNKDDKKIYFSIGAHPAFNVPFDKDTKIEDYFMTFKCNKNVQEHKLDEHHVKISRNLDFINDTYITPDIFKDDALIYSNVDSISIKSAKSDKNLTVTFNNFPYVGIWSPYNEDNNSIAPFVCIEPWYGIADTHNTNHIFSDKLGINTLDEKSIFVASYQITIN